MSSQQEPPYWLKGAPETPPATYNSQQYDVRDYFNGCDDDWADEINKSHREYLAWNERCAAWKRAMSGTHR